MVRQFRGSDCYASDVRFPGTSVYVRILRSRITDSAITRCGNAGSGSWHLCNVYEARPDRKFSRTIAFHRCLIDFRVFRRLFFLQRISKVSADCATV